MSDDYDRGRADQRMDEFAKHFAIINGSVADTAKALSSLTLAVQQLRDQHTADAATRVATAQALKEAADALTDKAREQQQTSDRRWSPMARLIAVTGVLIGIAGVIVVFVYH